MSLISRLHKNSYTPHAELGLYERARDELGEVLRAAPEMDAARFQLALLHLQLGRLDEARSTFSEVSEKSTDHSLQSFGGAYLALLDDRIDDAVSHLGVGIEVCSNIALKGDMTMLLTALKEGGPRPTEGGAESGAPVFLGAYSNSLEIP